MINNKILIISERWWRDGTGGIMASHLIAQVLQSLGFKLTVVHGTREPERIDNINYVYTCLLSVRDKHRLWTNCLLLSRSTWFLKALRECDVVYIPRYCYPIIPVAKKLGKRVIVHFHDYQPVSYNSIVFSGRGIHAGVSRNVNFIDFEILEHGNIVRALVAGFTSPMNRLCKVWLRKADAMICVSERLAEIISRLAPELMDKLKVVYNTLPDISPARKKLSNTAFLYLGGDSYVKGFHIFIRASQEIVKRNYYGIKFLVAGNFRDNNRLLVRRLNSISDAYSLLGHLSREEVLKLHSRSHALLFPSICEEPLPYAVLESMIMGTLPIASRVGGVPEIVEGTFAENYMFTPNDADELAKRMECVLSMSVEQLTNIGLSLREAVLRRFNQESIREKLVKVFSD